MNLFTKEEENPISKLRISFPSLQFTFSALIGREQLLKKGWKFRIAAGAEYSLWAASNGVSLSNSNAPQDYTDLKDLGYKKSGNLSALLRLEISKAIFHQQEINFSISGKASLNNVLTDDFIKERRYYLLPSLGYLKSF